MITPNNLLAEAACISTLQGYYRVGDHNFFNKAECYRFATKIRNFNITYHFLDSVYNSLDWTKEPSQSLDELYRERAQQLRDKYDYLILSFSGGSDSYNALRAFIDNDIKLDEVVTFYPLSAIEKLEGSFDPSDRSNKNLVFEYALAAKPILQQLQKRGGTKITVVDQIEKGLSLIKQGKMIHTVRGGVATSLWGTGYYMVGEIARDRSGDGKSVAIVYGVDKPRLIFSMKTKKFGFHFSDFANNFGWYPDEAFGGYQPKTEFFYYTPDLPTLSQKQAFVLKNAYIDGNMLTSQKSPFSKIGNDFCVFDAHTDFVKTTLYKTWSPSIWQAEKATTHFFTEGTSFFGRTELIDEHTVDSFAGQIKEHVDGIDPSLLEYYPNGMVDKMKVLVTRPIWF